MIVCDDAVLEPWSPDFSSSEQANPSWTRVTCGGVLLCNSLEWVEWLENPVQVVLCDACGHNGCASGDYVHISRLGDHLLWTHPQIDESDDWERDRYYPAWSVRRFGPVLLPLRTWARWREAVADLPAADQFSLTTGRELTDAWLRSAHPARRAASAKDLSPSLQGHVLASDSLSDEDAIRSVEQVLADLSRLGPGPLRGRFALAEEVGARIEVLYFDGSAEEDWPAIAFIGSRAVPAFSREWVFVPHDERPDR